MNDVNVAKTYWTTLKPDYANAVIAALSNSHDYGEQTMAVTRQRLERILTDMDRLAETLSELSEEIKAYTEAEHCKNDQVDRRLRTISEHKKLGID